MRRARHYNGSAHRMPLVTVEEIELNVRTSEEKLLKNCSSFAVVIVVALIK